MPRGLAGAQRTSGAVVMGRPAPALRPRRSCVHGFHFREPRVPRVFPTALEMTTMWKLKDYRTKPLRTCILLGISSCRKETAPMQLKDVARRLPEEIWGVFDPILPP